MLVPDAVDSGADVVCLCVGGKPEQVGGIDEGAASARLELDEVFAGLDRIGGNLQQVQPVRALGLDDADFLAVHLYGDLKVGGLFFPEAEP